jgi:hypothetical protein
MELRSCTGRSFRQDQGKSVLQENDLEKEDDFESTFCTLCPGQ